MGSGSEVERIVRTVYCLTKKVPDENYDVYVGSTSMSLENRLQIQKWKAKQGGVKSKVLKRMSEVGVENWKIVPLLTLECTRDEIRSLERKWCEVLEADLNTISPITSKEEARREKNEHYVSNHEKILRKRAEYREKNKEKVREQDRASYDRNREKILEKKKAHYEKNHERIRERQREYYKARKKD